MQTPRSLLSQSKITTPSFCVSHAHPLIPAKFYTDIVALGDYGQEMDFHISKLDDFWHQNRDVAWGAAGSYVIPKALETRTGSSTVVLNSYRKVVLRHDLSNPSPFVIEVTHDYLSSLPSSLKQPASKHDFLVSQPLIFKMGLLGQYNRAHITRDILDYSTLAIELGVLTNSEAFNFLNCPIIILGGAELGAFPTEWASATLNKLEVLGRAFVDIRRSRILTYDSYQVRVIGFLSERLGSFLVLRELAKRYNINFDITQAMESDMTMADIAKNFLAEVPPGNFGRTYCCVEEGGHYSVGHTR